MNKLIASACITWILVLSNYVSHANTNPVQTEYSNELKLNWSKPSQQKHIDNLIACEYAIQAHKWKKNLWPEFNQSPKPAFSDVVDMDQIIQKVLSDIAKENILRDQFNTPITHAMLQKDLNRMGNNSKKPQGLKALFWLLNDDPRSIAECVSRPYLVNRLLEKGFNQNREIHQQTKQQATQELAQYLKHNKSKPSSAAVSTVTLRLKAASANVVHKSFDNSVTGLAELTELNETAFKQTLADLKSPQLQTTSQAYVYYELLESDDNTIKVNSLVWPKQSLDQWLQTQAQNIELPTIDHKTFILPHINGSNKSTDFQPGTTPAAGIWSDKVSPETREEFTSVWTGTEMIVWGGKNLNGELINTGGRYNPETDSWQATSVIGAPIPRWVHSAVWTGTEMIVWGGFDNSNSTNTGGRYNPDTDTWQATSIIGAPSDRAGHGAVWTGTEMIIHAGISNGTAVGGRYDPVNDSWQQISNASTAPNRYLFGLEWTGSEMLVWGGASGSNVGERYDPNTDNWQPMSTIGQPLNREYFSSIWTGTEMIIWGGQPTSQNDPVANNGGRYNPNTDSWQSISHNPLIPVRREHSAVWTGEEMVVFGGINLESIGAIDYYLNTGGRYDPDTDSWEEINNHTVVSNNCCTQDVSSQHSAVWTGEEMIIWGGKRGRPTSERVNSGGRYNPSTDSWQSVESGAPVHRHDHSAIWTGNEMIVWGGFNRYWYERLDWILYPALKTGGRYDPVTDNWSNTQTMDAPSGRLHHTAVWTGSEMIVWGGLGGHGGWPRPLNTGGRYNPITNSWQITSRTHTLSTTDIHTAVWTGSEMIIWDGGNGGSRYDPINDSWQAISYNGSYPNTLPLAVWTGNEMIIWGSFLRYDPITDDWQTVSTNGLNGQLPSGPSATAVWTGNEMIVWGGNGTTGSDVLRYDPETDLWQVSSPNGGPSSRESHTAVWTGNEMIIWGGSSLDRTGGHYDPVSDNWLPTSITAAPDQRTDHSAVWTGHEMIIWGGLRNITTISSIGVYYPDLISRRGFDQ